MKNNTSDKISPAALMIYTRILEVSGNAQNKYFPKSELQYYEIFITMHCPFFGDLGPTTSREKKYQLHCIQGRIQTTATFALANLEKFTKSALSLSYLPLLTLFVAFFGFV